MSDQDIQRAGRNSAKAAGYVAAVIVCLIIWFTFGPFVLLGAGPLIFALVDD